jgi:hypothetical protein
VKNSARWSLALGATLALCVGPLAPLASAADRAPAPAAVTSTTAPAAVDWHARSTALAGKLGIDVSPVREAVDRALSSTDYVCGRTDLDAYVDRLFAGMTADDIKFLGSSPALDLPTYEALFLGSDTDPAYALTPAYRTELTHTFRDVKRFWDIKSSDIQLHAMHGSMLTDPARVARILVVAYGMTPTSAAAYATSFTARIAATPAFQGGNNPIFTLNAFAFTAEGETDPVVASIPDKLIFGDGILDALAAMGIADVGPRAVMGHEFGHHVQYEDNLFASPLTGPEATRRTELMADAFSTYFVTHSRGLALNTKRVLEAEKSFYEVGDCAFTQNGHHGTPNQRLRASTWGANLAASAQKQGQILPSLTVAHRFETVLPSIVAPDAS